MLSVTGLETLINPENVFLSYICSRLAQQQLVLKFFWQLPGLASHAGRLDLHEVV